MAVGGTAGVTWVPMTTMPTQHTAIKRTTSPTPPPGPGTLADISAHLPNSEARFGGVCESVPDRSGGVAQRVAGEALVSHHAERINIGAPIEHFTPGLFRTRIAGRAHEGGAGQLGRD